MNNILFSFLLTFIAGFSTLFGFILVLFNCKNEKILICSSLAYASGVMICISILDLIPEAFTLFSNYNGFIEILLVFSSIIFGIFVSFFIENKLSYDNNLYRIGIISMIAIIMHNIPEGIITFITVSNNIKLGISLTIAIIIHNIPEGISISVPIYYATKSKIKAFSYTLISAISEPLGGLISYLFLSKYINNNTLGLLFSLVAGIMIELSLNELLPSSISYNYPKITRLFFIFGIITMIINLLF